MWPDVLRQVQGMRRSTWMIISANAQVHRLAEGVLELAFANQGTARGFAAGQHPDVVAAAVAELLGITVRVQAAGDAGSSTEPATRPPDEQASPPAPHTAVDVDAPSKQPESAPRPTRASRAARTAAATVTVAPEDDTPTADDPDADDSGMAGTAVVEEMLGGRVIDIRPGG
jgi:DNA polymerase-3 subunit gamma/tau